MKVCTLYINRYVLTLYIVLCLIKPCYEAPSLTITSSSQLIGANTNMTITISNPESPIYFYIDYGAWGNNRLPNSSATGYLFTSGAYNNHAMTCTSPIGQFMRCVTPSPPFSNTIVLTITNVLNPSSAKPYQIKITLGYSSSPFEISLIATLTVNQGQTSSISISGYNSSISSESETTWLLNFGYYFDIGTYLKCEYDIRRLTLDLGNIGSVVTCTNTSVGNIITFVCTNWLDLTNIKQLKIKVKNPLAAVETIIPCNLEIREANLTYLIQNFTATFVSIPISYEIINTSGSLQKGKSLQEFRIENGTKCSISPQNLSSSDISMTEITGVGTNGFTGGVCYGRVNNSCIFDSNSFPKRIGSIKPTIAEYEYSSLTMTVYTYFIPTSSYRPLCSSIIQVPIVAQQLSTIVFNNTLCGNGIVGGNNNLTRLDIEVEGAVVGDIVRISGVAGGIMGDWRIDGSYWAYTLKAGDIITSSKISLSFPYTNPAFTTTTNKITNITVSRTNVTAFIYAVLSLGSTSLSLCEVLTPSPFNLTLNLSSYLTYEDKVNMTLSFTSVIQNYTALDYFTIRFENYEEVLFLNSLALSGELAVSGVNNNKNVEIVNDTVLKIGNVSRLSGGVTLGVRGLCNPATVEPIRTGGFRIVLEIGDASGIKERGIVEFSYGNVSKLYSYSPRSLTVSQSPLLSILVSMNQITITPSNPLTPRYFLNLQSSTITLVLPFPCKEAPLPTNSSSFIWSSSQPNLVINFTECEIPYLVRSTAVVTLRESIRKNDMSGYVVSSVSVWGMSLKCADDCVLCGNGGVGSICEKCVDPGIGKNFLYQGECLGVCPIRSYSNGSNCFSCHISCLTCSSSSLNSCLSCPTNFTLSNNVSGSMCISTCGSSKYLNNQNICANCEMDCLHCLSNNYCYICKEGAIMVTDGVCDFVVCNYPCDGCSGSKDNCSGCLDGMLFHNNSCYDECPGSTYELDGVCLAIDRSILYFPATITSLVLVLLICICNICISYNMTVGDRSNINILTYCSFILSYMELIGVIILLSSTVNKESIAVVVIGIVIWIFCNFGFGVYYWKFMRIDGDIGGILNGMSQRSRCVYYTTLVFAVVVSLRTYRVLYCGLFRGVAPYAVGKSRERVRKGSEAKIANEDIDIKINSEIKVSSKTERKNKGQDKNILASTKMISKNETVNGQSENQNKKEEESQEKDQESESARSTEQHIKFELKRPFIIYLTVGSLIGSLFFLIGSVIEIVSNKYPAMLFWGIDLLIVVICSIIMTIFDMWVGIKKSYYMAKVKIEVNGVNETQENLGGDDAEDFTQQKIIFTNKATQKLNKQVSPPKKKKYVLPAEILAQQKSRSRSPRSPEKVMSPQEKELKEKQEKNMKLKNRYNDLYKKKKKAEEESSSENDEIPDIKVFEELEMYGNSEIEHPGTKARKIKSDHKRMSSMNNMRGTQNRSNLALSSNISLGRGTKMNWKMDDIFLGFQDGDEDNYFEGKTVKIGNKEAKEVYNIKEKKIDKNDGLSEGEGREMSIGDNDTKLSDNGKKKRERKRNQSSYESDEDRKTQNDNK